jgi:hypothetical protein
MTCVYIILWTDVETEGGLGRVGHYERERGVGLGRIAVREVRQHPEDRRFESQRWCSKLTYRSDLLLTARGSST